MILDTALVIDRVRSRELIDESITVVTLIEFPQILEYKGFIGDILFPSIKDFFLAYEIQKLLMQIGMMKGFSDLLISAIAINNNEQLLTRDKDFLDISKVSDLKVQIL